eukprot:ctg_1118.g339
MPRAEQTASTGHGGAPTTPAAPARALPFPECRCTLDRRAGGPAPPSHLGTPARRSGNRGATAVAAAPAAPPNSPDSHRGPPAAAAAAP